MPDVSREMTNEKKVVAVLNDLLFRVKIQEAAKRAGFEITFAQSQEEALRQAQNGVAVVLLDLNDAKTEPLHTIEKLKGGEKTRNIPLLGYVSHVQTDLIKAAQAKGCDTVMARSAFVQNLPRILDRYSGEAAK
jgi:PleD family two-component response regulator